jgi:hypothetical protein
MTGAQFLASVSLYGCSRELIRSDHVIREPSGCRHEFVAAIYQIRGGAEPFYLVCRKCHGRHRQAVPRSAVIARLEASGRTVAAMPRLSVADRQLFEVET